MPIKTSAGFYIILLNDKKKTKKIKKDQTIYESQILFKFNNSNNTVGTLQNFLMG